MKKAEPAPTQRGRSALRAVHLYVLTPWNIVHTHIFFSHPSDWFAGAKLRVPLPTPLDIWNHRVRGEMARKI
jgi:hypothetical protein